MNMEQYIRAIAGAFILCSVLLSQLHSPYWLFFTGFVAVAASTATVQSKAMPLLLLLIILHILYYQVTNIYIL